MWFPTIADIRNSVITKGVEVDRLETLIEELRKSGDKVHWVWEPDEVCV